MRTSLSLVLGFSVFTSVFGLRLQADAVAWDGGGDGVAWNDANNWAAKSLPTPEDDVVISGVGAGVTIVLSGDATVRSLECSASFTVASGVLSLTHGESHVDGAFTVAEACILRVTGGTTVFQANGTAVVDRAGLQALGGAVLSLPGAVSGGGQGQQWRAEGAGSR
ncbi:MAG TPA: hypothetical protein PKM73_19015, partial [Verrucomicrobiota bacterium]|nr:hypothetical protein [Verrucomicrobiota bacterium]